ncbi:MAG: hypothetical protein ACRDJJ_09940 [Actinomycetota bacterium]
MHSRNRARIVLLVVLALSGLALAGLVMPPAGASHVDPQEMAGNPTCADLGDFEELKLEPVQSGSESDGTLSVTISVSGSSFDWSSNIGVDAVIVKGGTNANAYRYSPEETSDTDLTAPINDANDQPYGLSHISFCYDSGGGQTTSPPPSPTPPSSPSEAPPTTPSETESPTPGPTEEAPTVLPTRISGGQGPDLSGTGEDRPAPERVRAQQEEGALPFTGGGLGGVIVAGVALVAGGGGLFWAARHRRRT